MGAKEEERVTPGALAMASGGGLATKGLTPPHWCSLAAITRYHRLSGFKPQIYRLSSFWRPESCNVSEVLQRLQGRT